MRDVYHSLQIRSKPVTGDGKHARTHACVHAYTRYRGILVRRTAKIEGRGGRGEMTDRLMCVYLPRTSVREGIRRCDVTMSRHASIMSKDLDRYVKA